MVFNSSINTNHYRKWPVMSFNQSLMLPHQYNQSDTLTMLDRQELQYKPLKSQVVSDVVPSTDVYEGGALKMRQVNRFFNRLGKDIENSAKNGALKSVIKSTNDVVLPVIGSALGATVGTVTGNPVMGAQLKKKLVTVNHQNLRKQKKEVIPKCNLKISSINMCPIINKI